MLDRDALVDRIYEAAVIPDLWPSVLHDVSALAGCVGGILFTTPARDITRWTSSAGAHQLMADFTSDPELVAGNMRLQKAIAARHHGFFANHQLYTREEMQQSLVYTKFFFPRGLGYAAGTALPIPNGDIAIIDLERRYADGPVTNEEIVQLDAIRPHLARAAALSTRLNLERARAIVDALGTAGMPAAILGGKERILAANPLLETMRDQVVFLAHGKFGLANHASNRLFADLIARGRGSGSNSIPIPATLESVAAVLHALPLPGEAADVFTGARTLLVVTRLDRPAAPTAELLTGLFDLTASEARVARSISQGLSTHEIATALGLTKETVRFYLKNVFAKTGVGRQIDLMALLSGAALPPSSS
jgi:DNA-binding CsgD family transcriptional regulator